MEIKKGQITRIFNGEIITPEKNLGIGTVLISEGKIIGVEPGNYKVADSVDYDAQGGFIAPGFIDLHTHGAGDSDFMDCTEEDCLTIAHEHLKHGTTLLYPTTLASDNQELLRFLDIYDRVKRQNIGAAFGGLHLEGPYFAYAFRGAQDPRYLRNPAPEEYMEILDRSQDIVRWSIAPELPGIPSIINIGLPLAVNERLPRNCIFTPEPAWPDSLVISNPATLPCNASIGFVPGFIVMSSDFTEATAPVKSRFFTAP